MTHEQAQAWLDRYVEAWRANDPRLIGKLFSPHARYGYHPYGEWLVGRDAIVASWLESPDDPDSWDARYEVYAVDGDRAVATGRSHYQPRGDQPERTFWNCYLLRFAPDGTCAEFTEYYMREPA